MAGLLVDTDILIDVARGADQVARELAAWETQTGIAISAITYMELLVGCRNKREQRAVERFVERFEVILVDAAITARTINLLRQYRLSHGLLIADAFIAATAMAKGIPLVTRNQRDYRFIDGLQLWSYPSESTP